MTAYDRIGRGYAKSRQTEPRIAARVEVALGNAESVVNVGAGTGSYEPVNRNVIAVEPSQEMIVQRRPGAAPAICGSAERLPLRDNVADAAMAIPSVHHWGARLARRWSRETVPVPSDCSDLFLGALWARPELVLVDEIRASTSGFARMDNEQERAAVAKLGADLESGAWDERYGHLRGMDELDVGLRLVVCEFDRRA